MSARGLLRYPDTSTLFVHAIALRLLFAYRLYSLASSTHSPRLLTRMYLYFAYDVYTAGGLLPLHILLAVPEEKVLPGESRGSRRTRRLPIRGWVQPVELRVRPR
jgi:hypothetical protein